MIKKNILLLLIILASYPSFAQSNFKLGASFNVGFPTGSFSEIAKTGIGGSLIAEYVFNQNISASLSGSYQNFPGETEQIAVQGSEIDFSINSIPVLAAVKYYFSEEFFGTIETGVYFYRISADVYDVYSEEKFSTDYEAKFGAGLGLGYRHRLAEASELVLSGIYQLVEDDINSAALRLGVMILMDKI